MNKKWSVWIYPVGCLILVLILLIFVLTSSGCSPKRDAEHSSTTQAYASESTSSASETQQIFVCSHLGQDEEPIDFSKYASIIWVEPVTQNVFSVYYNDSYHRAIAGPLQGWRYDDAGGNPILLPDYQKKAEKTGHTLIYEGQPSVKQGTIAPYVSSGAEPPSSPSP